MTDNLGNKLARQEHDARTKIGELRTELYWAQHDLTVLEARKRK